MSDILVTSPYRPFTLPNQFKAVFNGYIYCGTVDAVDPSVSQVQVYLVNEDGSKVPVAQPLRTNAGGFLVYNGQPARFVTDSNHSLLVRDSLGNQLWYAPDMANVDPQSFAGYLAEQSGSSRVGFIQYGDGAVARTAQDKMREILSVKDFGATGDGVTPDNAAVHLMISAVGFARFTIGSYSLYTDTFDAQLEFESGASISVPAANTVTITARIDSSRQQIFKGDGVILLRNDANSGEDSHNIHASWFGVFPVNDAATDMAPALAKLFAALDNTREAVVDFDVGRYPLGAASAVPRATWIRGSGSRRTIFEVLGNGYDVFTALSNGVRFSGIQFELSDSFPTTYRNSGWFINSNQQLVELEDVWISKAAKGILLSGGKSTAKQIRATYDVDVGVDSCTICVEGSDSTVEDVMIVGDEFGPASIVSIGGEGINNISSATISGVRSNCKSIPVSITAKSKIITGTKVNDVNFRGLTGFEPTDIIHLETSGTGTIEGVSIDGIMANDKLGNAISIKQNSSGATRKVSICNSKATGGTGVGVKIERILGTLDGVVVDQTVDVLGVATPFQKIGTVINISLSPVAQKDTNFPISYDATIADDGVYSIAMPSSAFTGIVMLSVGFVEYAITVCRAVSTAQIATIIKSANVDVSTVVLTGTTGVDGKVTLSSTAGAIYVENRLGSSQRVSISLLYGVK